MSYEKLKKIPFKTESYEFQATHCGDVILVDTNNHNHDQINRELLTKETENHPEKEKLVFFPFSHVRKFTVPDDNTKYRIRYKFEDGKVITSDTLYTALQVNSISFISIATKDADYLGYVSTNLHQVVPETFFFAVIMDNVKVIVLEGKEDNKLEPTDKL